MTRISRSAVASLAVATWLGACGDDAANTKADTATIAADDASTAAAVPTWYQDIQPIVYKKCSACHQPGQIAPFSVLDYATSKKFAPVMVEAVEAGRMPPFSARATDECTPRNKFANDPRLSDDEKALLRAWSEGGAPEGDADSASKLEEPAPVDIERADVVMKLPEPIVVKDTGAGDLHTCLVVDPGIAKDGYVVSRQVTSGNPKVLHHVTTYIVSQALKDGTAITREEMNAAFVSSKGVNIGERYPCFGGPTLDDTGLQYSLLGSWAPGGGPVTSPPNSGQPVSAGSVVVLDMHYHPLPSVTEVDADTEYALQFADAVPMYIAAPIFMGYADPKQPLTSDTPIGSSALLVQPGEDNAEFKIPAGAKDHVEEWTFTWKLPQSPLKVYFAASHMHYAGRDLKVTIEHKTPVGDEGAVECLEQTPAWDFNWQLGYSWDTSYADLPTLRDGDTVHVRCTYDNVMQNRAIAAALSVQGKTEPVDILVGEDTLDEMCLSLMGISYPNIAYYQ